MKRALLSLMVIVAVAALGGVGTYAEFSDYEVSRDNYFAMGEVDLQLGDTLVWPNKPIVETDPVPGGYSYVPDEDFAADPLGDSVFGTWDRTLGYPNGMEGGDFLISQVKIRNAGTVEASRLDISCLNVNTAPPNGPLDKDTIMIITELLYRNNNSWTDLLPDLRTASGKAPGAAVSLDDLEHHAITGLTPPLIGNVGLLRMTVLFERDHPTYAGCTTMMTMRFDLFK